MRQQTPMASPETSAVGSLPRCLSPRLPPVLNREQESAYRRASTIQGTPARERVRGCGICATVRGSGSGAYGHRRRRRDWATLRGELPRALAAPRRSGKESSPC